MNCRTVQEWPMSLLAALKTSWWSASNNSMQRTALRAAADAGVGQAMKREEGRRETSGRSTMKEYP